MTNSPQGINDRVITRLLATALRHFAHVEALEAALKEAIEDIYWMSAASDFAPGAKAHEGWAKVRERTRKNEASLLPKKPDGPAESSDG